MEGDEVLEYSDPRFSSDSFAVFNYLREKGELCDVNVKIGHKGFLAHRVVLAAGIPYLRPIFSTNDGNESPDEITVEDVEPTVLERLVDFLYCGRICITDTNVETLLKTSTRLQMKRAMDACFHFFKKWFTFDTVLRARDLAKKCKHEQGKASADDYICQNFEEFATSTAFLTLPLRTLKELISRDDLFATSEEVVFEAVMRWVKSAQKERCTFLTELLPLIRLSLLKPTYLTDNVSSEKLIQASPLCKIILGAVSNCSATPAKERYCREKHHLKCAKVLGSSFYAVFNSDNESSKVLKYYDGINRRWDNLCNMPRVKEESYLVCSSDKIYLIHTSRIYTLDLKTLSWTYLEGPHDIPVKAGILYHADKIYFFREKYGVGGQVQTFCPERVVYRSVGSLLDQRMSPCAVSFGKFIYVTGGITCSENFRSVEKFDPEKGNGVEIAPMLENRFNPACAALNDRLYVFGGYGGYEPSFQPMSSAEVYNPETNQWTLIAPMSDVRSRLASVPYAGKLCVFTDCIRLDNVFIYDPTTNEWSSEESMRCEDYFSGALSNALRLWLHY